MSDQNTTLEIKPVSPSENTRIQRTIACILGMIPKEPEKDFQKLCQCWLTLTGADWAWLWINHQQEQHEPEWEVVSVSHNDHAPRSRVKQSNKASIDIENPVVEYCSKHKKPICITDVEDWNVTEDGENYRVLSYNELKEYGCKAFLMIPFDFPSADESAGVYSVLHQMKGALALHFKEKTPKEEDLLSENQYRLMGQVTASAIAHSLASAQFKLLYDLEYLAAEYLTAPDLTPQERRAWYLEKVIQLIQNRLNVSAVSIFYRTNDQERIECVATTGIERDGVQLPSDQLASAWYYKGDHRTGKVYETGTPFVYQGIGYCPPSIGGGKHWAESPSNIPDNQKSWALWPICMPTMSEQDEILGVIRCVDNHDRLINNGVRPFDPVQLQTLKFIAEHLAPVLDTMAANILRAQTVSFIKHDLYAPLRVIESETQKLQEWLDGEDRRLDYIPNNIKASVVMAKNLAGSLSEQVDFSPEPTYLEGDIIARLRDGLGQFAWGENRMRIDYRSLRDIPMLKVDRNLIERVVCNLLINAIKYGFEETEIEVIGEENSEGYIIFVENWGIGIEHCDREHIFEGMYRSETAKERNLGLGLGLKIARDAMRRHGGDLILQQHNNPTIFAMIFPKSLAVEKAKR